MRREAKRLPVVVVQDERLPDELRPKTRGGCETGMRPCPFASCRHHLAIEISPVTGSIKFNFPDVEIWNMKETCALDIADRGGITLEEVGEYTSLTRERVRQLESHGLKILRIHAPAALDEREGRLFDMPVGPSGD